MKVIRVHQFGGPEVPQVEEVQSASAGPGEILIRVRAAGVNPSDTYMRSGAYGGQESGTSLYTWLQRCGHE